MPLQRSLGAGLAGTVALTLLNELGHRVVSESPRLDVLGMRALVRALRAAGREPPEGRVVPAGALLGDLLMNSLYYGLTIGRRPRRATARGLLAGLAAGVAASALAPSFGMNARTGYHWGRRLTMVAFYTAGGLATAAALHLLARR
jgi:ABC-type cobalamin transport system permease subunit